MAVPVGDMGMKMRVVAVGVSLHACMYVLDWESTRAVHKAAAILLPRSVQGPRWPCGSIELCVYVFPDNAAFYAAVQE